MFELQKSPWGPLEHQVWKKLKSFSLEEHDQFLLSVSGGLDSMVLLKTMLMLKPKAQFLIAHFHHGDSECNIKFRNEAFFHVKEEIKNYKQTYNIEFYSDKAKDALHSEADLRSARLEFLKKIQDEYPKAILTTGHHKDDLLETWLLKLARGTGSEGLDNFKFWNRKTLRPLIDFSKQELLTYAQTNNLRWVEDPTNAENDYLRNWLRNVWLPQIEEKMPGSTANITNSLARLLLDLKPINPLIDIVYDCNSSQNATKAQFQRAIFMGLSDSDQLKTLARALRGLGHLSFSQGQLEEIRKRLDKNQKDLIFSIAGVKWFINAEQIMVELEDES